MVNRQHANPETIKDKVMGETKGNLTVFLGAAAGVGKTYAMLETAKERLVDGVDVVVGWVEDRGQFENHVLLQGASIISPLKLKYQGESFNEMNLDELLKRRPQIAVVDELAHTNAPGSRHEKRYQDIEELLSAGIDVYTTMNIQHLESLNDVVAKITGVQVQDTVPDVLLEKAEIKLIDIPTEDLIQRFKEGKVYVPEQDRETLNKFFRPGNINALRELALRYTAQHVDRKLETYMRAHAIAGPWPAGERVMVCVSPSPFSAQLIRVASRIAAGLQAEWLAAYVEAPGYIPGNQAERDLLAKNLRLAEELGAETIILTGNDPGFELLQLARRRNVTQIIIGRPLRTKLKEIFTGSVVDRVIRNSEGISVHVIPGKKPQNDVTQVSLSGDKPIVLWSYISGLLLIVGITILNKFIVDSIGLVNVSMLYLLPILYSSTIWGIRQGVLTSILGVITFDFFYIPPSLSFTVTDLNYLLTFIIFLFVAWLTGTISARLRQQVIYSKQREARTAALYALSREIAEVDELNQAIKRIAVKIAESVEAQVTVFLPDGKGTLSVFASSLTNDDELNENELAAATWVFEHGQIAGRGTSTLSGAEGTYLPLSAENGTIGVLGVKLNRSERFISSEQRNLLEALAALTAFAITRFKMADQAKENKLLAETERLYSALFNSISHELRTPLASIIGSVTSLLEDDDLFTPKDRQQLMLNVKQGALRMERLVSNLLDMARLESGLLKLKKEWCDVQDLIGVASSQTKTLRGRDITIIIEPDMPLISADFVLMEQVLSNLLDNAAKYSKGEIIVSAQKKINDLEISISDYGPGIPFEERERIFDKFYRLNTTKTISGTGLGLTICKTIVEAHGGRIRIDDNPSGGVVFVVTLPISDQVPETMSRVGDSDGEPGN